MAFALALSLAATIETVTAADRRGPPISPSCRMRYLALAKSTPQTPAQFKAAHQEFNAVTAQDNLHWIDIADHQLPSQKLIFVDSENSMLKELNDKILKDKDMATAVTNWGKEIAHDEVGRSRALMGRMEAKYSDFKSLRAAIKDSPEAHAALEAEIIRGANANAERFGDSVRALNLTYHTAVRDPSSWILTGYGATADEAGAAAKKVRQFAALPPTPGKKPKVVMSFEEALPYLNLDNARAARLRAALEKNQAIGNSELFTTTASGRKTLTPEAFDAIRKSPQMTEAELAADLSAMFRTRVDPDTVPQLRAYLALVDGNVPGVRAAERVRIPVEKAEHGLVSVDFSGQNSRNLFATAEAMAAHEGRDARTVLKAARAGERRATDQLNQLKSEVETAAWAGGDTAGLPLATRDDLRAIYFSGDDGMIFPERALTLEEKRAFLKRIASGENPSNFRVTFLPPQDAAGSILDAEKRMPIIQAGEDFEKDARKLLAKKLGVAGSRHILLAMDLEPQVNSEVALRVMALSPTASAVERRAVYEAIKTVSSQKKIRVSSWEFGATRPVRDSLDAQPALNLPARSAEP